LLYADTNHPQRQAGPLRERPDHPPGGQCQRRRHSHPVPRRAKSALRLLPGQEQILREKRKNNNFK